MGSDLWSNLVVCLLIVPAAAALIVGLLGPGRRDATRWISLGATVGSLIVAAVLAWRFAVTEREAAAATPPQAPSAPAPRGPRAQPPRPVIEQYQGETFHPQFAFERDLLPLGTHSGEAIKFFVGLDGLNVWLIVLTAVLMVPAVLVSWTSIDERVNEFYAWLLLLETGMLGVFLAFDIVLFYVFFELTLVPLFFVIGIWGGPQRRYAARKFFIYTLAGSLITLLGVLGIVLACHARTQEVTFEIPKLLERVQMRLTMADAGERAYWTAVPSLPRIVGSIFGFLSPEEAEGAWGGVQFWVFLALMAGFAIKVPLVPLHTWLPLAHVEAPTAGSVLLAGVLLKIGAYGFLRLCLPLAPDACHVLGVPLVGSLAVVGIVYGALCAVAQDDIKKLVAYSSVSHLGFCMLGMFAFNAAGLSGSLLQMINHGLSTGALFLLVGMLYERYHTRLMGDYGGMAARLRLLACFMVFFCLTSIGLPGLNGFVGEVLVLMGSWEYLLRRFASPTLTVVAATGVVLGAWYLLTMLYRVFFGPVKEPHAGPEHGNHSPVSDLGVRELAALVPIAVLCVVLGVYPQPVLDSVQRDIGVMAKITRLAEKRLAADAAHAQQQAAQVAARTPTQSHEGPP
jgi:NADH-quinone oxidoreductase subunit M